MPRCPWPMKTRKGTNRFTSRVQRLKQNRAKVHPGVNVIKLFFFLFAWLIEIKCLLLQEMNEVSEL